MIDELLRIYQNVRKYRKTIEQLTQRTIYNNESVTLMRFIFKECGLIRKAIYENVFSKGDKNGLGNGNEEKSN
jgi:hypothetical protein